MNKNLQFITWLAVGLLGLFALSSIALNRGESINALWLITAAVCIYALAYRFYVRPLSAWPLPRTLARVRRAAVRRAPSSVGVRALVCSPTTLRPLDFTLTSPPAVPIPLHLPAPLLSACSGAPDLVHASRARLVHAMPQPLGS
jgi:hypothetical protein